MKLTKIFKNNAQTLLTKTTGLCLSLGLCFNMPLSTGQKISRGPYLQMGTSSSIMIKWRTDVPCESKIIFGKEFNKLNNSISDNVNKITHALTLNNLEPNTKYFYTLATNNTTLQSSPDNFFITAPRIGSEQKVSIWALGDMGMGTTTQTNVYLQYLKFINKNYTNLWLLLGDNAYGQGKDDEYQIRFFDYYQSYSLMKQTPIFPSPGNHDYSPTPNNYRIEDPLIAYFDIFDVPKAGEIGGIPSKTKAYYSYDYANIHFISLDSYGREELDRRLFSPEGNQMQWLERDLAQNKQKWTIVYWHHPPYTMGSHNSDTESELKLLRENLVPVLEKYKVDLVLNGHSHNYERSKMMKGHYGLEKTFDDKIHTLNNSTGTYNFSPNSCPYIKNSNSIINEGIVYVVNGCGGANSGAQTEFPHNAMAYSNAENGGSLYIEIEKNKLEAKFITEDGNIKDQFTIFKDINQKSVVKAEGSQKTAYLKPSWKGSHIWKNENIKVDSLLINVLIPGKYIVQDAQQCLQDEFIVNVPSSFSINDFNVLPTKNGMLIEWIMNKEIGISSFEIEKKSADGTFFTVATIEAKNLNATLTQQFPTYRHYDSSVSENSIGVSYRLKIIDFENKVNYSKVQSAKNILNSVDE
jgi:hypothetical protein